MSVAIGIVSEKPSSKKRQQREQKDAQTGEGERRPVTPRDRVGLFDLAGGLLPALKAANNSDAELLSPEEHAVLKIVKSYQEDTRLAA